MIVFIDDSGDPGFKIERGASKVFVIACVVFDDELEAEKTAIAIKELKRELKFSDKTEFKFNKSQYEIRKRFLNAIKPFKFKIRTLWVDKNLIKSNQLKENKNSFYSYFIKTILKYSKNLVKAKIRIDGSGDRIFRKKFLTYLRRELNSKDRKVTENIRLLNSKTDVLIQMADMVAGTVRRYKEGEKKDAGDYWKIIEDKVEDCWDFK